MGSKYKHKSDDAKESFRVMIQDVKIKILHKLLGSMTAAAVGLTFR